MRVLILIATALLGAATVNGQTCPADGKQGISDKPSVLQGTLLLHEEIREWIGLKLDQPACGLTEVQLVFSKPEAWREAKSLRGCKVTATGQLFESPTGYYSADVAISNGALKPDASCKPSPIEEDPGTAPISPNVKTYHASIIVDYRGKGHVDIKVWQGDEKSVPLTP
jgi:hypothetical protein